MIKIYYAPRHSETREALLIKQGLENNSRVELVDNEEESRFVFQFYYINKREGFNYQTYPSDKTVLIDYSDMPLWEFHGKFIAYFKRSWPMRMSKGNYVAKKLIPRPSNFHPLSIAIMDEFIIKEDIKRDIVLSCTLRRKHLNRNRVRDLLEAMNIQGKTQIGEFNKGQMRRFNEPDMRDYFRLLKRSKIVVTCNPSRWEGDHRTWEAFANGALVFVDRMLTPLVHPLIDGQHCIFYELSDQGLAELRGKLFYFLENKEGIELAAIIARQGFDFTMKYHRSSNRIDEILEVII